MKKLIEQIIKEYPTAKTTLYRKDNKDKSKIENLFNELQTEIENLEVIKNNKNLEINWSIGQGNWVDVPWLIIKDKRTYSKKFKEPSAQYGMYIGMFFAEKFGMELTHGQNFLEKTLGHKGAVKQLEEIGQKVRQLCTDLKLNEFEAEIINFIPNNLKANQNDIELRKASSFYKKTYRIENIPEDFVLIKNIEILLNCYEVYINNVPQTDIEADAETTIDPKDLSLNDVFINKKIIDEIIETLKRKKNIILQGAPGVGKTFVSKKLAYLLMNEKDNDRIGFVQFHQSYSYEDFVQGWRPNGTGFSLKNGVFYEFCKKARENLDFSKKSGIKEKEYVFIIDEINRGNLTKIFGELLMLIEADKRDENAITLAYSENEQDKFSVPSNIFIIGLMNTADKSLAMVDYALRRRFAFFTINPGFSSANFEDNIKKAGGTDKIVKKIREKIGGLNETISNRVDLGEGFQIGHSYFCTNKIEDENKWYENVINHEIKPLIEEYWSDDRETIDTEYQKLL
jgi:MoxR-like ATPase